VHAHRGCNYTYNAAAAVFAMPGMPRMSTIDGTATENHRFPAPEHADKCIRKYTQK